MTAAGQSTIETIAQRLTVTRWRGRVADAKCPAHDDGRASLTFGLGDNGGAVLHCHAGCDPRDILSAIGMTLSDLSPEPHVVASYDYRNEAGELLWHVDRYEPKDFRCRPGLPAAGFRRLYRSEWLPLARERGALVYIVEGEKDADNLAKAGEVAVCGVGGAGSWLPQYTQQLAGLDVVVVADADEPGEAHARSVTRSLDGVAANVSLVSPSFGKDVSDQLAAGYGLNTMVPLSVEETLGVLRADRVREREVSWLWDGYLPLGKMAIVEGDPGDGKSVMTCDLAARFSTGAPLPDGSKPPFGPTDVVMISAEDDPEDTIRPRLRVAGADLKRIHLVVEGTRPGSPFDLSRDLPALEDLVTANQVKLVVIDPLMAFMPATLNAYSDHEVRRALHPMSRMAARNGTSILVVRHLTKGRTKAITAGGGSIAFIGAARVGYLVGPHPDDESKRVLTCVKINVGVKPAALGYRVVGSEAGNDHSPPKVTWDHDPLEMTAQDVLDGTDAMDERDAKAMAKDWLIELLSANHSGMKWQDITRAGKREDHSEATLRRVRRQVAKLVHNPMTIEGTVRTGAYWVLLTAAQRDGHPEPPARIPSPTLAAVPELDDGPEFSDLPEPGPCDLCGGEPAVPFGPPHNCRRCFAHSPLTYRGDVS